MANPFETSTTYVTNTNNNTTIKYTNSPNSALSLGPGELGYNYATGNYMIGPLNPSNPNVILISQNNSFYEYLTADINLNVTNKVPTSRAVAIELDKKASIMHSNQFTGMNEFPYLRVIDAAPAQENIVVTIKMLREYLEGTYDLSGVQVFPGVIEKILKEKLPEVSTPTIVKKFRFMSPIKTWDIEHNMNTDNFSIVILDTNNKQNEAPVHIVDLNHIQVLFTAPVAGEATVTFNV